MNWDFVRKLGYPLLAFPLDIALSLAATVLVLFMTLQQPLRETSLVVLFVVPFVLVVPGYVSVAALFPMRRRETETGQPVGLTLVERFGFSVVGSILIVTLTSVLLYVALATVDLVPLVSGVSAFVAVTSLIGVARRLVVPSRDRFNVPWRQWVKRARTTVTAPSGPADALLTVVVVVAILLVAAGIGYAAVNPEYGDSYTEFFLVTEDENGELVADEYPREFTVGQSKQLVVGVTNKENSAVSYTVLVEAHRVTTVNNTTRVLEKERLGQFRKRLARNETWYHRHSVAPTILGNEQTLQLTYLLYRGEVPQNPTRENAYRRLQLRVNVTSA
jgi:uncharacterized membrane protein